MRKRSPKQYSGRRCASCPSKPRNSWICRPCIECGSGWVMRRTAVVNQIRGLLLERGFTLPKGRSHVDQALPGILADPALRLAGSFRVLLGQLQLELEQLSTRIEQMDVVIQQTAKENEACQRLTAIPGIGP